MADEFFTQNPPPAVQRRRGGGAIMGAVLIAFVIGAGAVGYAAWQGIVPAQRASTARLAAPAATPTPAAAVAPAKIDTAALGAEQASLESRMAALDDRLDTLDLRANAASGNAARAEALLIAFAARRALDRGSRLGYIEDQLRLRFGDGQPNAVATVIEAGKQPITLDQLLAGLDSLAPSLTQAPADIGAWAKVKREFASLFVIRRESAPSPAPQVTLGRARVLLEAGKTEEAIAEVQRLPGAHDATDWFTAARSYDSARRALDVLETTAMLDTHGLKDAKGAQVNAPSPIAPTVGATEAPGDL